jgi:hypothetical protein
LIRSETALTIVELRRRRLTQARIAQSLGVSKSSVGRVLRCAKLSRLRDLEPCEPVVRYEHEHPGDLIHIDTKKLGRIERMGKRIPGSFRSPISAGWEYLFVAVDDHARIAFTDMYPNEAKAAAVQFLHNTLAYFRSLGPASASWAEADRSDPGPRCWRRPFAPFPAPPRSGEPWIGISRSSISYGFSGSRSRPVDARGGVPMLLLALGVEGEQRLVLVFVLPGERGFPFAVELPAGLLDGQLVPVHRRHGAPPWLDTPRSCHLHACAGLCRARE